MKDDGGSVSIWMLGLAVMLLLFGGLAIDFWRALAMQRELAASADSAVIAAASGVDEEHYRMTGEVRLDPPRARNLGMAAGLAQGTGARFAVEVGPGGAEVTVTASDSLELGLLGLFAGQTEPLEVRAKATAEPVLVP